MNNLLVSLALGTGLIVLASLALARFSALGAARSAGLAGLIALMVYLPLAIINWPGADVLAIHVAIYLLTAFACGVLLSVRERQGAGRLHWGPALIIGFFVFLVVINAVFIRITEVGVSPRLSEALFPASTGEGRFSSAFPGVVSHDFYKKESYYNAYLEQVARQQERGWQIRQGWIGKPAPQTPTVFRVVAQTRDGAPLPGAQVSGQFLRPADSRLDVAFAMSEVEPGVYETELTLPAPGLWNLVLQVRKGDDWHEVRASTSVGTP